MARNKTPGAEPVEAPLNIKAIAKASAALTEMGKRSAEIAERFGDGLPYERERMIGVASFYAGQAAEALLYSGKALIQIKENEPFGEFMTIIDKRLGLEYHTANRMMTLAVKYLAPALSGKVATLQTLGRSKLLALLTQKDDDLAELAEGGTIAGKTLDEMEAMSVRELRDALAEARQTNESRQKLLDKANSKVDRLQEKLDRPYKPTAASIAQSASEAATLQELNAAFNDAHLGMLRVATVVNDVFERHVDGEPIMEHARACIDHVVKALASLASSHDIVVDHAIEAATVAPWIAAQLSPESVAKIEQHAAGRGTGKPALKTKKVY